MPPAPLRLLIRLATPALLAACGGGDSSTPIALPVDPHCDLATAPSAAFEACETANLARTTEAPAELDEVAPGYPNGLMAHDSNTTNFWILRAIEHPTRFPLNNEFSPQVVCAKGASVCMGDPKRHPDVDGADGQHFREEVAEVHRVLYLDRHCNLLSGHVWQPRNLPLGERRPGVVIRNAATWGGDALYWWAAQALVRAGYVVLTHDPYGEGASEHSRASLAAPPDFSPEAALIDSIAFLQSSPTQPHPQGVSCRYSPATVDTYNPAHTHLDATRIGVAGHGAGAMEAASVQSHDAPGATPWPGSHTADNPIRAIVAWDGLGSPQQPRVAAALGADAPLPFTPDMQALRPDWGGWVIVPRVPALGFTAEYGVRPVAFEADPPRNGHLGGFSAWRAAGIDALQITIAGATPYDFALMLDMPATSWCPTLIDNACRGGWARPMIEHYTVAWFDRWLKAPGTPGHDTAEARLLDDATWAPRMSHHFASARSLRRHDGKMSLCVDIRLGCQGE